MSRVFVKKIFGQSKILYFPRKTPRLRSFFISNKIYIFKEIYKKIGGFFMTHDDIWHAIERFATEHGMSCSGLARCSGLDPTTFNKSKRWSREGQPRWPSTNSISKILASTGASIQDFTKYIDNPSDKTR